MTINRKLKNHAYGYFLKYGQSHPVTLTLALLAGSTMVSVAVFKLVGGSQHVRDPKEKMSLEEARLIAMLENAKETTWKQNLENAAEAQDRFMLPNRQQEAPNFMSKIDERSKEILKNQHDKIDREKKRKVTTRFWS